MEAASSLVIQMLTGVGLAACAGLRAFLPLLVVGIAGRLDYIPLSPRFEWLASWPALIVFGVAVVTEILADKVPFVDNLLDVAQGFVKPVAGVILVASVVSDLTPLQTTVIALVLGGGTAAAVQVTKAKIRLVSSATTAGAGNPLLSIGEDAGSLAGSILALVVPVVLIAILLVSFIAIVMTLRRFRRSSTVRAPDRPRNGEAP